MVVVAQTLDQLPDCLGLADRVHRSVLAVIDEEDRQGRCIIGIDHEAGDLGDPEDLQCAVAAMPRQSRLVFAVESDDQGLQKSVLPDAPDQVRHLRSPTL